MNAHDRCLRLVATTIDFDLDAADRHLVDRHLATCSTCRHDAAGIAADAATIAALPRAERRTVSAGVGAGRRVARNSALGPLRLVAIAALIALLAVGALAAGGELIRRLDDTTLLGLESGPRPTAEVTALRSPSAESPRSLSPTSTLPPCVTAPSIEQLVANGGAWGFACLGSRSVDVVGYIPTGDGASVCEGWEPQWLSCPSGSFIASRVGRDAPMLAYAHDGDVPVDRPSDGPDSVDGQPIAGSFARFTGHYGDSAAGTCQAVVADAPLFNDRPALQKQCRETFVVTALALLVGAEVPPPVVDASWTLAAGPTTLAAPPSTVLRSIVEAGDQWFVLGFDNEQARSYLWRSADARTWEPIEPVGFAPVGIATDGTRLFGIGGTSFVEVRTSLDGRIWTPVPGLPSNAQVATVAATSQGVFAGGGIGIDAAIWRFDKDLWSQVTLPDAAGIQGGQDAAPAYVRSIADRAGSVMALGDGPPPGGVGFPVARIWESKDGVNWGTLALPDSEAGSALAGLTISGGFDVTVVGARLSEIGPASWATRGGSWVSGQFPAADALPTASLSKVIEVRGALIAIGLAPTRTDSLKVVVWGSSDGVNWSPLGADEMAGGFVVDAIASSEGRVFAVGWMPATGTGDRGPAIWELVPTSGR